MNPILKYAIDALNNNSNIELKQLSANPNITFDDVINNPNINWCHEGLSMNPNITIDIIKNNMHINWSFKELNKILSFDDLKQLNNNYIYTNYIAINKNITFEQFVNCKNIPWPLSILRNPNITMKEIDTFNKYEGLNKINNTPLKHKYLYIIRNPNLDEQTLMTILDEADVFLSCADWDIISSSSIDFLKSPPLLRRINKSYWCNYIFTSIYSHNTNVPNKILEQEMNKEFFNWVIFSTSYKVDINIALKYHNKVSWNSILKNPKITMFDIEKNMDRLRQIIYPDMWSHILENPNITLDFIKKYINILFQKDNLELLFNNPLSYHPFFKNMKKCMERNELLKDEILEFACHPFRLYNCHDNIKNINPVGYELEFNRYNSIDCSKNIIYVDNNIIESCEIF
jgi:hypothetical protein